MIAHLVSCIDDQLRLRRVGCHFGAAEEERRRHIVRGEGFEHGLRVAGSGAVVEGQGNDFVGGLDPLDQLTESLETPGVAELVGANAEEQRHRERNRQPSGDHSAASHGQQPVMCLCRAHCAGRSKIVRGRS